MDGKTYLNESKWIILAISIVLVTALLVLTFTQKKVIKKVKVMTIEYKNIRYADEITEFDSNRVAPIVYDCHADFTNLPGDYRKEKFIELILPAILVTRYELEKERTKTLQIWSRVKNGLPVSHHDSLFIKKLKDKYQTDKIPEILIKQEVHPTSIVIAQAALESGWGTSRFFNEGNNLFGIWSYDTSHPRVSTLFNRNGKSIYVKKYNTVKDCIEDYFLTIANSWAYSDFRNERMYVKDPLGLIWYLSQYSELRYDYVEKIGELMIQNDLQKYDNYHISGKYFVELNIK